MNNHNYSRNKERIYKQLASTNALLIFWIIIIVIARFGSLLPIVLFGMTDYDNHLNLFEDYWIIFALIPIVVFMQSWFSVRLVYRSGKWMILSIVFCIITAFVLQLTTKVDQQKLNNIYHQKIKIEYQNME